MNPEPLYHPLTTWLVSAAAVPIDTVILLLLFPIVATLMAFLRQFVGIKAFGVYTPSMVTFAFIAVGIKYGVAIYVVVIAIGVAVRTILRPLRLLYLPRIALTLSIVALATLLILGLGGATQRTGLASAAAFPLLIMIMLVENFITVQSEKGTRTAIILAGETLAMALGGYALVYNAVVIGALLHQPWLVLLTIPVTIILGRWTGLRLTEYVRFRTILPS